jgi:uncharacterized protein
MVKSISRVPLILEIVSKGVMECEIVRHLSPLTVSELLNHLPVKGRIHKMGQDFIYVETGLRLGKEKQRSTFKLGEVAYLPSNGSLCIFLRDKLAYSMNPLGMVTMSLDVAERAGPGDVMILMRNQDD